MTLPYDLCETYHNTIDRCMWAERTYFPCVRHANKISAIPIEWGLPLAIRQATGDMHIFMRGLAALDSFVGQAFVIYDMVSTVLLPIEDLRVMTECVFLQKIKTKRFHFLSTFFLMQMQYTHSRAKK